MDRLSDDTITERLEELEQEFASAELFSDLYGLEFDEDDLQARVEAWAGRHYDDEVEVFRGEQVHRWRLETFLQNEKLLPVKWAGARLGMTEKSFRNLAEQFIDEHLLDWEADREVIREADVNGLRDNFSDLKNSLFGSHGGYCEKLHKVIEREFGLEVEPLYCETSKFLDEEPLLHARGFDSLTYEPVSTKYENWLQTGKPMHLRPDSCSTLTLVVHEELLEDHLLAGEEAESVDLIRERLDDGRMRA